MRTRRTRPNASPDDFFFHEPGTSANVRGGVPVRVVLGGHVGVVLADVRARGGSSAVPRPIVPGDPTEALDASGPEHGVRRGVLAAGRGDRHRGGARRGQGRAGVVAERGGERVPFRARGRVRRALGGEGRHNAKNLNLDGEFHAFAVEWDKSSLRYYVDGVLTNVLDRLTVPIVPRWPFYLILNTEMSPFGMPDAMTECDGEFFHYVDYVRVYRRAEVAVHANVYRFLSLAAIGALVTLSCAACVALRRNLDDDDEWASREEEERIRVKGLTPDMTERYFDHDSEDYYAAVGGARRRGTTAPKTAGHERKASRYGEPLRSGSGSSGSDLRLLDAGSRDERRLGGEASVERRRRKEERAPLIGGVGLRMPTDSTPSHSSHGSSSGGEYGGAGGRLRWRNAREKRRLRCLAPDRRSGLRSERPKPASGRGRRGRVRATTRRPSRQPRSE